MTETCGNCRHWFKLPPDPNALGTVRGQCREGPPHATSLPANGGTTLVELAAYPKIGPDFPACSRFAKREE